VRFEPVERGDVGQQPVDRRAGGVGHFAAPFDVQPDALADPVLRRDPRDVFGTGYPRIAREDPLLGNHRRLELQQHVAQPVERERETGGNFDRHMRRQRAPGMVVSQTPLPLAGGVRGGRLRAGSLAHPQPLPQAGGEPESLS
jgi:hypothetical protein